MKFPYSFALFFALVCLNLQAKGINSTNGEIDFDIQFDDSPEMTLNNNGLGGTNSPTSNLNVHGSLGFGC